MLFNFVIQPYLNPAIQDNSCRASNVLWNTTGRINNIDEVVANNEVVRLQVENLYIC